MAYYIGYWEAVYYGYMALSSIGVDATIPHTPGAVAYVGWYALSGLGLLTLVAEDVYGLYWSTRHTSPTTRSPQARRNCCGATARRSRVGGLLGSWAPSTTC